MVHISSKFIKEHYSVFLVFILLLIISIVISYIVFQKVFLSNEITTTALSLTITIFIFMFTLSNYVISNMSDILSVPLISSYQYSNEQMNFIIYQFCSCFVYLFSLLAYSFLVSSVNSTNNCTTLVTQYAFWNNFIVISNFLIFGFSFYYLYKIIKLYLIFNNPIKIVEQIIRNINQKKYSVNELERYLGILGDIIINYSKIDDKITEDILKEIFDL